jgi:ribonuclease VapC
LKRFVDASALVAILTTEPGFEQLILSASEADQLITSGMAQWETIRALTRTSDLSPEEAVREFDELVVRFGIETVQIGEREALLALEAHRKYGKGNHDARLNMGDCFAYACAKANGAKLLYKGGDFALTDLA